MLRNRVVVMREDSDRCHVAGFEQEMRRPLAKECGWLQITSKGKETDSFLEPQERNVALPIF